MKAGSLKKRRGHDPVRSEKRRRLIAALVFLAVSAAVLISLEAFRCKNEFVVAEYRFTTDKVEAPVRLVMVSDLHESSFGEGNCRLIEAVKKLEPDAVLCAGDMITLNDTEEQTLIGLDLIQAMAGIAPTYMSLGNHECIYAELHGTGILDAFRERGATLLEETYLDTELNGQHIRIGGVYGYCFNYGQARDDYLRSHRYLFLKSFCGTDDFKVLLCHKPTSYYLESEAASYENWDLDLVLSGHTHGGLWRLPGIGSLYLPQQGVFPKLDHGRRDMGNAEMVIGAGLGHEAVLFRLFDPCEIVLITLVPAGSEG